MKINNIHIILLALLSAILFLPFNGHVHLFDWDEINFAENAREMIMSGNYLHNQIAFKPFFEKPPLFIWAQVLSMKIFGINEFAARFPNALAGFFSMWMIFSIGRKSKGVNFAWLWVLVYLASLLPQFYFRSGIIDPMFNLFIYGGISLFYFGILKENVKSSTRWIAMGGILIGLAMLAKGPVALLVSSMVIFVYFILADRQIKLIYQFIIFCLFSILPFGLWIIVEWLVAGPDFIVEFIRYQLRLLTTEDAGHGGFPGYHFIVVLFGCFPASVFALPWLTKWKFNNGRQSSIIFWNKTLFWVVLILFSLVQSKIVHYSSLSYFPLSFLAANYLLEPGKRNVKLLFGMIGILVTGVLWLMPILGRNPEILLHYTGEDQFVQAILSQSVHWPWYTFLPAILSTTAIIHYILVPESIKRTLFLFILCGNLAILSFTGRIEKLTQGSVIDFIVDKKAKEGVYTDIRKQKSYADLFYGKYEKGNEQNPAYIIHRIDRQIKDSGAGKLVEIERKNGFVFYRVEYPNSN